MAILHRTIHPKATVLDERKGIIEYVASDESVDRDREVIRAEGWRFDQMEKNAPFLDSHNYSSVESGLGKVIDFRVENKQLVNTVQWAIDVPENTKALLGFNMTKGGYLKAVSVGFSPVRYAMPSNGPAFADALKQIGKTKADGITCIYLEQQQFELSACLIGANPNALAKAIYDGLVTEADVEQFWPALHHKTSATAYSFSPPPQSKSMSQQKFVQAFEALTGGTREKFEGVELARRGGDPAEIAKRLATARLALTKERRHALLDPVARILADREKAFMVDAIVRHVCKAGMSDEQREYLKSVETKSTMFGDTLAASIWPTTVGDEIQDLIFTYGAFRDLGVQPMSSQQTRFAKMTALPDAWFITPTAGIGVTAYTPDVSLAGLSLTEQANTIATLLPISNEWLRDVTINTTAFLMRAFGQGMAKRIDYGAMQGNGADDQTNGLQTGIFANNAVAKVSAANGNVDLSGLQREDFLLAVAAVNPAALQRPCRWYIHPGFIPVLLTLREANGTQFLLKTPADTGSTEWHLCGFPVTWSSQNPSAVTPGSPVALFGEPSSYLVALRDELGMATSDKGTTFYTNVTLVRALMRGRLDMRDATGFAILNLAAK